MVAAWSLMIAMVMACAVTDVLERKIYNVLTLPLMLIGIALHAFSAEGSEWWQGLAGLFAVGLPFFGLYAIASGAVLGAGDVKLLMAIGALAGVRLGLTIGVVSIILGGGLSFISLMGAGRLGDVMRAFRPASDPRESLKAPYGLAIAGATFLSLAAQHVQ